MQYQFVLFRQGQIFYCEDRSTGNQTSLRTNREAEARKVIAAKNEAVRYPLMNIVLAQTNLAARDTKLITRT